MNRRQYRDINKGENEWLSEPLPAVASEDDQKAYASDWADIRNENKEAGYADIQVEFTEDIYVNEEYLDAPEWINVTIKDSGVLPFKMAQGIIKSNSMEGLRSMEFTEHFDLDVEMNWGGWSYARLSIYKDAAYVNFHAKHASGEVEVNITEQFNQAIGEEA